MRLDRLRSVHALLLLIGLLVFRVMPAGAEAGTDPLPSWNEGATKQSIIDYVTRVTKQGGPDYVVPKDRLATIDNDGTLWVEKPIYTQFVFAIDEVKRQANQHPEWKSKEPFKSVLAGDMKAVAAMGEKGMVEIVAATHSGMTTTDFNETVKQWLATAKHPRFKVLYTDLVYQPMIELLDYLHANGFKTFIVSGGGVEFMRTFVRQNLRHPARAGHRLLRRHPIWDVGREAGADQNAESFVRRRRPRQARGHRAFHRASADLRLRQFRWGQRDARMDGGVSAPLLHGACAPYRRVTRIRL